MTRADQSCSINVTLHNLTKYHLSDAGFGVKGVEGTFEVGGTTANMDSTTNQEMTVDGGSCLGLAHFIDLHASESDGTIGTCDMSGVAEGDCQKLFTFRSATDYTILQKQIDGLKAGNLAVGDILSADSLTFYTTPALQGDGSSCYDDNLTAKSSAVHLDGDGVADAYQTTVTCSDGKTYAGWVSRWMLKTPAASPVQ